MEQQFGRSALKKGGEKTTKHKRLNKNKQRKRKLVEEDETTASVAMVV